MQKDLSVVEQFKQIGILYYSLLAGQLSIAVLLFFFVEAKSDTGQATEGAVGGSSMSLIVAFICVVAISTAFFVYNKRKEIGRRLSGDITDKLAHYRASFMVRAAMIEGANLTALMFYFFVEKNIVFLVLFAIGIGAFIMIRPTVDQIAEDYQLSASEQSQLRDSLK